MSRAAKSHAREDYRQRASLVWFIVEHGVEIVVKPDPRPGYRMRATVGDYVTIGDTAAEAHSRALAHAMRDLRFNVAAVRAAAEKLVALELPAQVFRDWTRTQGRVGERESWGPENKQRGAFAKPLTRKQRETVTLTIRKALKRAAMIGGWPGHLASEFGTIECEACEGRGRNERLEATEQGEPVDLGDGSFSRGYMATRTRERCKPCRGKGRIPKPGWPRASANGAALAQFGRRILAAIDGQPSECRRCNGRRVTQPCADCQGSGHNLAGRLAPAESTPQLLRRSRDSAVRELISTRGSARNQPDWMREIGLERRLGVDFRATRTVYAEPDPRRPLAILREVERSVSSGRPLDLRTARVESAETRTKAQSQNVGPRGRPLSDQLRFLAARGEAFDVASRLVHDEDDDELAMGNFAVQCDSHVREWIRQRWPAHERGEVLQAQRRERIAARRWSRPEPTYELGQSAVRWQSDYSLRGAAVGTILDEHRDLTTDDVLDAVRRVPSVREASIQAATDDALLRIADSTGMPRRLFDITEQPRVELNLLGPPRDSITVNSQTTFTGVDLAAGPDQHTETIVNRSGRPAPAEWVSYHGSRDGIVTHRTSVPTRVEPVENRFVAIQRFGGVIQYPDRPAFPREIGDVSIHALASRYAGLDSIEVATTGPYEVTLTYRGEVDEDDLRAWMSAAVPMSHRLVLLRQD